MAGNREPRKLMKEANNRSEVTARQVIKVNHLKADIEQLFNRSKQL